MLIPVILPLKGSINIPSALTVGSKVMHPPRYKPKLQNTPGHAHTNQAFVLSDDSAPFESMLGNLSSTQCQQLIALLSS